MIEADLTDRPRDRSGSSPFLDVRDLHVHFATDDGLVKSVDGLNFSVDRGRTLGIVGESGSGKSVTSLAVMGLHKQSTEKPVKAKRGNEKERDSPRSRLTGEILLDGVDLVQRTADYVRSLRGKKMAMIFQDPLSSMNPYYTIGDQIIEAYQLHNQVPRAVARKHAVDMLGRVGIPEPSRRVDAYPHQFSGGMRQRAMIAMALSCDPDLLIADEPTTALDVTVQAQILDLIRDLQREFDSAVILITHDLGVVAEVADDILVMYAGRGVEYGSADVIFNRPLHPYTWGLLGSVPSFAGRQLERLMPIKGSPPSLINVPRGCAFHPRCEYAGLNEGRSESERPELEKVTAGHLVACHLSPRERERLWVEEIEPRL
jgi:peptide/nickel transport system ATP-binding protein